VKLINNWNDRFRTFEGQRVSLSLVNGTRIDDCQVVSAARGADENIWVFSNGADRFVALSEVVDCWEEDPPPGGRAA
jgi:hypothetical protein